MDSVYVPVRFGYIRLTGSVQNPGLYPFQPGKDVAFYVRRAAGYLDESMAVRLEIHDRVSNQTFEATEQTSVGDGDEVLVSPMETGE
ncbi:MAG: hypothetical protein JSU65_14095 [Candidatus Zixiibacteriota bacterium]|nr:MAG: hypothetical protein JSU65_14095 [candidate division Zixibacteria bacterium]